MEAMLCFAPVVCDLYGEKRKMNSKRLFVIALLFATVIVTSCESQEFADDSGVDSTNVLTNVTVNTSVRKTGQYPENFVLTFEKEIRNANVAPESFHLSGEAGYWGSDDTRSFEAVFSAAEIKGNTLTLTPDSFPEKYFYVKQFKVDCSEDSTFDFSSSDISEVITPVADDFETYTSNGSVSFDYHLFDPKKSEPMPVVIVFHGYGDTNNLLTYRTAVEWGEPENQEKRPCFVLAPVIDDNTYFSSKGRDEVFTSVHDIIGQMISDGKVDADKVYVMGNSFGGLSTIEYAEKYPEEVAGALALCPALNYSNNSLLNLKNMVNVPVWFAHAKNDNTIPASNSETAVKALENLGAKEVRFTEYTDEEMNAAGADSAPDATYSYHHVELAVMEDDAYMEWLFEQ